MRTALLGTVQLLVSAGLVLAQPAAPLPGTAPLTATGDLSAQMVEGIDRWLMHETARTATNRARYWPRDFSSPAAYEKSVEPNRERLRRMIGAVDERDPNTSLLSVLPVGGGVPLPIVVTASFRAEPVRWLVFKEVTASGWLLSPLKPTSPKCFIVAIPDADQTPEMLAGIAPGLPGESQFARRLAEAGCTVLIPALLDRRDEFSGNEKLKRFTNQPHREWIYRQAYEMGRHIIGYEVQTVQAGLDAFHGQSAAAKGIRTGVIGYGEGGLIALYAAALDARINAVAVSGYFGARERLWEEPIYRNVAGLLREFGDAEIASLIAPRKVIVEFSATPKINGPPAARQGRGGAAPGKIAEADFAVVEAEVERARGLVGRLSGPPFVALVHGSEGAEVPIGSTKTLTQLLASLGVSTPPGATTNSAVNQPKKRDPSERSSAVREWESFTQKLFRESERVRDARVWSQLGDKTAFLEATRTNREFFWREVIGKLDAPKLPPNPRTRQIYDQPKWTGYEVMLDVVPDVSAWGYLLVPKDLKPGEKRPVVVCQHGLEGVPEDTVADDPKHKGYGAYKGFAAKLAERGFIVYAPHNPYRGQDKFRVLQRKANPLGLSLFSFIIAQHEVTTDWLALLPFVDPQRLAFYGLSYGGKTAMRVPAVVERYSLSICSADFNEWVQKCVTTESPYSYMFTGEYEMPEWNLGHTFNYAEMASLIAPRPFMVERGHDDGVAPDQWVAYEYAKIRRMYDKLGIGERTEIEFFDGPHTINGVGTFQFLEKHLRWPLGENPKSKTLHPE